MGPLLQVGLSNCLMALALALVAAAVGRCCRRPAVAHGLWLLVLLKLVTPPLVPVRIPWPEPERPAVPVAAAVLPEAPAGRAIDPGGPLPEPAAPAEEPQPEGAAAGEKPGAPVAEALLVPPPQLPAPVAPPPVPVEAVVERGLAWPLLAGALWLGGAACWFAVAAARIRRFGRVLRHGTPAPAELQAEAEELAARLGLARCPQVWLVTGAVSPMMWALGGAARLLVPEGLLERLTPEQRATLLAHELAHLRRRDHWVRVLELLVLGLYWWFPLVWWARRELREAEEECCDAWVVWALPDSPRAYATALVETLDFLSGARPALPPAASGVGPLPLLRRRLTMIMRGTTPRSLTGAGFLALCGLGVVLLPLMPSWAQPPGDRQGGNDPNAAPGKRAAQLDKAHADLKRLADDLDRMRHDLDKKRAAIEKQAEQLHKAMEEMHRAGMRPGFQNPFQKPGAPGMPGMPGMPGGPPDLQKRLADVERKLDLLLTEVLSLRHEMGKQRPGAGGRGAPGGVPPGAGGPGGPGGGFRPGARPNPNPVPRPPGGGPVNPPPNWVKGKILRIDPKDLKKVQVDIGTDAGVQNGHTLEVYRLQPQPEYCGRIRILVANKGTAVGQWMNGRQGTKLEVGDEVVSVIR